MSFTSKEVIVQRLMESDVFVALGIFCYSLAGFVCVLLGKRKRAFGLLSQVHRTTRDGRFEQLVEPFITHNLKIAHESIKPAGGEEGRHLIGIRILVVKRRISDREKGVVIVKFSESLRILARAFDLSRLMKDYYLVLEPSWSGYCDKDLLFFTQFTDPIFVMAAEEGDYLFMEKLGSNLVPLNIGPCDWVDPSTSEEFLGAEKKYDIVFNSNWGKAKRHHVLFASLAKLKEPIKVALIGNNWGGRTRYDVQKLANYFRVNDQLVFFESIPYREVMKIQCQSKFFMLLSLKEGSNRAASESLFCDVPIIVLDEHVGGIRKNVNSSTGRLVREAKLVSEIESMLLNWSSYRPREWALRHVSCYQTSKLLSEHIRYISTRDGQLWTMDIATKANKPEMTLVDPLDTHNLSGAQDELLSYLWPQSV